MQKKSFNFSINMHITIHICIVYSKSRSLNRGIIIVVKLMWFHFGVKCEEWSGGGMCTFLM